MKVRNIFRLLKKNRRDMTKEEKNHEQDHKSFIKDRENMRKILYFYKEDKMNFFSKYEVLYEDPETGRVYNVLGKNVTEFYKDKIKSRTGDIIEGKKPQKGILGMDNHEHISEIENINNRIYKLKDLDYSKKVENANEIEFEIFIIQAIEDELTCTFEIDSIRFLKAVLEEYGVITLYFVVRFAGEEKWETIAYSVGSIEQCDTDQEEELGMDNLDHQLEIQSINNRIHQLKDLGLSRKEVTDGWHSFKELYYHRMVLTLALAKAYPEKAWKSKQHHDGTMFEGSFIVGFNTPEGLYSYHYGLEYWELFKDVNTLNKAPEYDGHQPKDVDRLLSLLKENGK